MTIKNISLFSLLLVTSFANAEKKIPSNFQAKLDQFNQETLECSQEWIKAKEACEEADNCETCEIFQKISAKKAIIAEKIRLIEDVKELHARAEKFGIEGLLNKQRAMRKIIDR